MPHAIFHGIEMMGVKFYSRDWMYQKVRQQVIDSGDMPADANIEHFVLSFQAEFLFRAKAQGEG